MPGDEKEEKKTLKEDKPRIESPKPKEAAQIAIDVEEREIIETEVVQELEVLNKSIAPVNVSDQAKMVLDIFSGKVIE